MQDIEIKSIKKRHLVPNALNEKGQIVNISEVDNGMKCNCTCMKCGERVVAKNNGKIKEHHFAHMADSDCGFTGESALHYMAKYIIAEEKKIFINNIGGRIEEIRAPYYFMPKFEIYSFTKSLVEEVKITDDGKFQPDVVLSKNGIDTWIEVVVTHYSEERKIDFLFKNKIDAISVDLSKVDRNIKKEELRQLLISDKSIYKNIYLNEFENFKKSFKEEVILSRSKNVDVAISLINKIGVVPIPYRYDFYGKSYVSKVTSANFGSGYAGENTDIKQKHICISFYGDKGQAKYKNLLVLFNAFNDEYLGRDYTEDEADDTWKAIQHPYYQAVISIDLIHFSHNSSAESLEKFIFRKGASRFLRSDKIEKLAIEESEKEIKEAVYNYNKQFSMCWNCKDYTKSFFTSKDHNEACTSCGNIKSNPYISNCEDCGEEIDYLKEKCDSCVSMHESDLNEYELAANQ